MVLVSVLGALGILYIMVVQMSSDAIFTAQYYGKIHFKERAYYISRSAYSGVNQLFAIDDPEVDSMFDHWAQGLPSYHIDDEQVYITVEIEDQERYFNINSIMDKDTVQDKQNKQFQRLLEILELPPDLSNAVLDWIDRDHDRRMPMGADGLDYTDIPSKGGKLDSLEELNLIRGITPDAYQGRIVAGRAIPGLKDVLSVYGNGKINVNTAGNEILRSLDDEMTLELASEIIRRREQKPFQNMDELLELPGMNSDLLYRIKQLADVKSEFFRITLTIESYDQDSVDLVVYMQRTGSSRKIVYWQAN